MRTRLASIAVVATLVALPAAAAAQAEREVAVRFVDGSARLSFDATDLVDAPTRQELRSGLRKRIVVAASVVVGRAESPVAQRRFGCALTYDLWQDRFVVELGRRRSSFPTVDAAIARCLDVHDLQVGDEGLAASLQGRDYRIVVQAEFEPLPASRCRALLRQSGSSESIGPIFVSVVRREICAAERSMIFRSRSLHGPSAEDP